jgi:group I intron endonuclease
MSEEKHVGIIYLITNNINQKSYVGLTTKDVNLRFSEHIRESLGKCKYAIHKAIRKHGKENFTLKILEQCLTLEELRLAEQKWISELGTFINRNGYNMTFGGDGALGRIVSEEQKRKSSEARKGVIFSDEHKKNIGISKLGPKNPMFGKHLSKEHRKKIGAKTKGRKFSEERCKNISNSLKGKKQTYSQKTERQIEQIDLLTGQLIQIHQSINSAARSISDKASASNILYVCLGKRNYAYGFKWRFIRNHQSHQNDH